MYTLNDGQREKLRASASVGAVDYKNYLVGKDFLIICADGTVKTIQFLAADFRHLTGIKSDLDDNTFFINACKNELDIGNILVCQKYNWHTLNKKKKRIEQIHKLIYANIDKALFLINLRTTTRTYPVAIKNSNIDACIGFVDNNNKAKTLRTYNSSQKADEEKEISVILKKEKADTVFKDVVYLTKSKIKISLSSSLYDRLDKELSYKILALTINKETT